MPKQEFIMKLLRFGVVGGTVTLVFMGLNKVFSEQWGNQIGFLASYPLALTLHFLLNKWWTFANHRKDKGRQVSEYLVMAAITFCIQWAIFTAVVTWTRLTAPYAALIANAAQMAITFVAMDRRIFSAEPRQGS